MISHDRRPYRPSTVIQFATWWKSELLRRPGPEVRAQRNALPLFGGRRARLLPWPAPGEPAISRVFVDPNRLLSCLLIASCCKHTQADAYFGYAMELKQ